MTAQTLDLLTWRAPDTDDHVARHQRGLVRLPYDLGEHSGGMAGDLVPAWVCCDPMCGGVELGAHVLDINHGCCDLPRFRGQRTFERGRHRAGAGRVRFTGAYHGPFTAHWIPPAVAA